MKVGFIGTGLMGAPMAAQLLTAGHELAVYNRTASKTQSLKEKGAVVAGSPAEAMRESECIVLMLTDGPAVNDILFKNGLDDYSGKTIIQMSTIAPTESVAVKEQLEAAGGEYFECPVLGSIGQAETRTLILMVGANEAQFAKWAEFLKCFGPEPKHIGEVPKGAALKLAFNQMIPSLAGAFALSLSYVQSQGIRVDDFMELLRGSALYTKAFDNKLPRMLERNFDNPNFPTKHMLKDVDLVLAEASQAGLDTTGLEGVRSLLLRAIEQGLQDGDYSSFYNVISPSRDS